MHFSVLCIASAAVLAAAHPQLLPPGVAKDVVTADKHPGDPNDGSKEISINFTAADSGVRARQARDEHDGSNEISINFTAADSGVRARQARDEHDGSNEISINFTAADSGVRVRQARDEHDGSNEISINVTAVKQLAARYPPPQCKGHMHEYHICGLGCSRNATLTPEKEVACKVGCVDRICTPKDGSANTTAAGEDQGRL